MDFHDYLRAQNLAPKTVVVYERWVRRLERWCWQHRVVPDEITQRQMASWSDTLPQTWPSRKSARQAMNHWMRYQGREDEPQTAIYVPPKPRYTCRALSVEGERTLRETAILYGGREGLAVLLGLYLAARRAEIATMTWEGYSGDRMRFVRVKSGNVSDLKVHRVLRSAMDEHQRRATSMYLFPGDKGRPHVSPTTVWEWVRHVGQVAGIAVTTHALRHTSLAAMNDATGDLRATQHVADHASPETTALYTRATRAKVDAAIDSLPG